MSGLTIFSLIVLAVCFIIGIFKGAVQALFRLIGIVLSCVITVLLTPYVANALNDGLQDKGVPAGLVSGVCAFIIGLICIIIFSIITWIINKKVSDSILSRPNRVLGGFLYAFLGLVFLILVGYVINIFSNVEAMQGVIADTQKDAFSRWLVSNNLFNSFMEAVAREGGAFDRFIDGFRQSSQTNSGDMSQTAQFIKTALCL